MTAQRSMRNRCGWLMIGLTVTVVLLLAMPGAIWAQGYRNNDPASQAEQAGDELVEMLHTLLTQFLATGQELSEQGRNDIDQAIQQRRMYQARFNNDQKASLVLLEALLAHYMQDPETVVARLRQAQTLAPQNGDVNDTTIVLALYWRNYELARSALQARDGGSLARVNITEAPERPVAAMGMPDPNASEDAPEQPAAAADPNSGQTAIETQEPEEPAEPSSPFSQYTTSREEARRQNQPSPRDRRPSQGGGGGYAPGGGLMAPPDMYGAVGGPGGPPVGSGGMPPGGYGPPAQRPTNRQPQRATNAFSESVLELPVDYMPYQMLGQSIEQLQLQDINSSFFLYQPDGTDMLLILLWALPEDEGDLGSGRSSSRNDQFALTEDIEFEVETELNEVLGQFQQLFYLSQMSGIGRELAINMDSFSRRMAVAEASLQNAWPWANCMANNPMNRRTWQIDGTYSSVVMFVGADGVIRYVGPIGGFLPRILLDQEAELVIAARREIMDEAGENMQRLFNQTQQRVQDRATRRQRPAEESAEGSDEEAAVEEAVTEPPVQERQSNMQAENILRGARAQRIVSPRRACEMCDEVLDQYPDSLEADEARLMIESMLRRDSDLREEREAQGLYVGP
ncbi:MAG: hypothetical protein JW936_01140 [Sedimentisphaerales bacterium]|nr:hypothetical protein [Sedimentisphaerales bacterium]